MSPSSMSSNELKTNSTSPRARIHTHSRRRHPSTETIRPVQSSSRKSSTFKHSASSASPIPFDIEKYQPRYSLNALWRGACAKSETEEKEKDKATDAFSRGVSRSSSPVTSSPTLSSSTEPPGRNQSLTEAISTVNDESKANRKLRSHSSYRSIRVEKDTEKEKGRERSSCSTPPAPSPRTSPIPTTRPRPPLRVINANISPNSDSDSDSDSSSDSDSDSDDEPLEIPPFPVPSSPVPSLASRQGQGYNGGYQVFNPSERFGNVNAWPHISTTTTTQRLVPPPEIIRSDDTWSEPIPLAPYVNSSPPPVERIFPPTFPVQPQNVVQHSPYVSINGMLVPRVSFRITPLESHSTYWDVEDGDTIPIRARLEILDLTRETYYHHATISVRSYLPRIPLIRGVEHNADPQFVLHYKEPPRKQGSCPNRDGGINVAAIESIASSYSRHISQVGAVPSVQSVLGGLETEMEDDDDDDAEIETTDWVELPARPVPIWAKHFAIYVPTKLFATRESRLFQIEAKVTFLSKLTNGRHHELQAPPSQVSMTLLHSAREMGICRTG